LGTPASFFTTYPIPTMARTKAFDEATVLRRARDLFWEQGYRATSIQELEVATGLSRSSIYRFFGGKRSLYDRTLEDYQRDSLAGMREILAASGSLRTRLRALFNRILEAKAKPGSNCSSGCYIVNSTTELATTCQDNFRFVNNNREKFVALFTEAIREAQQREEISGEADPVAHANLLFTGYSGLQVVTKTGMPAQELSATIDQLLSGLDWT
jgi:TetR/AcrR family transcriptional repressor of nem operon